MAHYLARFGGPERWSVTETLSTALHAEPIEIARTKKWTAQFCPGRFWHTVRHSSGRTAVFKTEDAAIEAARAALWAFPDDCPVTNANRRSKDRGS